MALYIAGGNFGGLRPATGKNTYGGLVNTRPVQPVRVVGELLAVLPLDGE
jgi:hypothetical protein